MLQNVDHGAPARYDARLSDASGGSCSASGAQEGKSMRPLYPARLSIILAIVALALAACAADEPGTTDGAEPPSEEPTASPVAEEPNELLVLEWSGYEAEDFWADFREASPETEVTFEF